MKAITFRQPEASLIAHGIQDIYNRSYPIEYRGKILIHSDLNLFPPLPDLFTKPQLEAVKKYHKTIFYPAGVIIGEVEIVDCVVGNDSLFAEQSEDESFPIYNWVFKNAVLYDRPKYLVRPQEGIWEFEEVEHEI